MKTDRLPSVVSRRDVARMLGVGMAAVAASCSGVRSEPDRKSISAPPLGQPNGTSIATSPLQDESARPTQPLGCNDLGGAYITEDCINCGACEPECPNQAIREGDMIHVIDPRLCTECVGFYDHFACQAVCPVECCLPDPKRASGAKDTAELEACLIARALSLHPKDQALKERVAKKDFPSRLRK